MSGFEMVGNFVTTEHANAGTGLGDGLMTPRGQLNDMWSASARPDSGGGRTSSRAASGRDSGGNQADGRHEPAGGRNGPPRVPPAQGR
ncbi:hypothetical protein, partial [Luedemannella flava]|uniref:hypothetical protein n=1 Tax=Luedemannella flava TaxID=349316 RepID=UPI0031D8FD7F